MSFENDMQALEDIVKKMESGQLSLEQSIELFEKGVQLSKTCQQHLSLAEKKIQVLMSVNEETGEMELSDLNSRQEDN